MTHIDDESIRYAAFQPRYMRILFGAFVISGMVNFILTMFGNAGIIHEVLSYIGAVSVLAFVATFLSRYLKRS